MPPALTLVAGLALLLAGAELLVRGAVRLAGLWGLSPLVIGLTVVAFGTSTPELAVSVAASARGTADLAVANVVGSNIFNIFLILGMTAAIRPLAIRREVVVREVPLVIAASVALWLAAAGGGIGRAEAGALLTGLAAWTVWSVRAGRRTPGPQPDLSEVPGLGAAPPEAGSTEGAALRDLLVPGALVAAGLAALVLGSRWLVEGATALARALGVAEAVIGLTLVAAGTSLPEVATSAVAALRGEQDVAVGNVLGSNLFNLLGIIGVAGLASPVGLPVPRQMLGFDVPVMLAAAVACLPLALTGRRIDRWEGALLVAFYLGYVGCLAGGAAGVIAPGPAIAVLGFGLPVILLTAAVAATRLRRG